MGARNVLATNLAKKINWGPRRAVKKKNKKRGKKKGTNKKKETETKSELSGILLFIEEVLGAVSGMAGTMHHCKLRLGVSAMGS